MKCASSAEADVFVQAVALCIAVTSPTARRCDLHCLVTASGGNNRFRNQTIGIPSHFVPMGISKPTTNFRAFQITLRKVHLFGWRTETCLMAFCKHHRNLGLGRCLQEDGRLIPSICDSRM